MAVKDDDGKVLAVVRAANRRAESVGTTISGPSIIMPDSMEGVDLPGTSTSSTSSGASTTGNLAINTGATPRHSGVVGRGGRLAPLAPGLSISIDSSGRVHEDPVHPSPFIAAHEPLADSSRTDRLFGRY
jgi:hypothetical protein